MVSVGLINQHLWKHCPLTQMLNVQSEPTAKDDVVQYCYVSDVALEIKVRTMVRITGGVFYL